MLFTSPFWPFCLFPGKCICMYVDFEEIHFPDQVSSVPRHLAFLFLFFLPTHYHPSKSALFPNYTKAWFWNFPQHPDQMIITFFASLSCLLCCVHFGPVFHVCLLADSRWAGGFLTSQDRDPRATALSHRMVEPFLTSRPAHQATRPTAAQSTDPRAFCRGPDLCLWPASCHDESLEFVEH